MKKLRAGLAALVVACIASLGLVLAASPAQAWDIGDSSKPPPRIAPPAGTTAPNVTTPLTKPMIPPGIMGTALKFLGTAGLGYMMGSTYRTLSCAGGVTPVGAFQPCTEAEKTAFNAKVAADPLPVDPLPDQVWCVFNGGCGEMGDAVANLPTLPNTTIGQYTWGQPVLTGESFLQFPQATWAMGDYCKSAGQAFYNANCVVTSPVPVGTGAQVTVEVLGKCKNAAGAVKGLFDRLSTAGFATDNQVLTKSLGQSVCSAGYTLQWIQWRTQGGLSSYPYYSNTLDADVWTNPAGDLWKNTVITTEVICKNGAGQTATVSKTGPAGTGLAPVVSCPAGYVPDSGSTSVGTDFLTAPKKTEEWSITPTVREAYPDCIGWQSAGCKLMIQLDGVECGPGNPACHNWEEIWRLQPSRVKCKWGPYDMDISHCLPLRNAYISENGTVTDPKRSPLAAPISVDPFGKPLPDTLQNPDPNYTPAPTTTAPGGTTGSDPFATPVPIPPGTSTPPGTYTPPTTSTSDTNCWPGGTAAFNPLEWVLMPVKCALSWAFVPSQATAQAQMTRIQTSLGKVGVVGAIGTVTTSIQTVGAAAGSGSGCTGPTFHFDFDSVHQELQPFNACAEPVATMAAVSNAFTTVVVIVMGLLGVVRALGSSVGFNFTMGKGGGS